MTEEIPFDWITEAAAGRLSRQRYGDHGRIEGVELIDLRLFSADDGDFCEIFRLRDDGSLQGLPGFRGRQLSFSSVEPGAIKAWHLHRSQEDLWFVPPSDRLTVGLWDVRRASSTRDAQMRIVMGTGTARLLLIPRGVAHGVTNQGTRPMNLVYFTSEHFRADDPDEYRLPFDALGSDFWSRQPG